MIYTEPQVRRSSLDEFTSPMSDALGAAAVESWTGDSTASLSRSSDLIDAEFGKQVGLSRAEPETSLQRPEEARQRVRDAGLDGRITVPEEGIRGGVLDLLISRHLEQQRRQDILARSPTGFWAGLAKFAASFGASAMDPLNVASAFVPVVGEERYARMLANAGGAAGRAFVRGGVGAIEGATGALLLEPIVYGVAQQEQVDYTLSDTLANIAMGTVLGGGLHIGVGALADAARGAKRAVAPRMAESALASLPERIDALDFRTRATALRTAVAQAVTGRRIDVEPVLPKTGTGEAPVFTGAQAEPVKENAAPLLTQAERERAGEGSPTLPALTKPDNARLTPDEVQAGLSTYAPGFEARQAGKELQVVSPTGREVMRIEGRPTIATARLAFRELARDPEFQGQALGANISTARGGVSTEPPQTAVPLTNRRRAPFTPDPEALQIAAQNSFKPENMRMAEPDTVRQGEERFKAGEDTRAPNDTDKLDVELAIPEVVDDARRVAEALGVPERVEQELKPFEALAADAEAYGRAVMAAATCQLRRGA